MSDTIHMIRSYPYDAWAVCSHVDGVTQVNRVFLSEQAACDYAESSTEFFGYFNPESPDPEFFVQKTCITIHEAP